MPGIKNMALTRLKSIERRMDRDRAYGDAYCQRMERYLTAGYAEEVPPETITGRTDVWYLPHIAVFHAAKPGKIRVVHDAAARASGVSLNSLLLAGPDLYNCIVEVLCRFRERSVAFTADITEMFLRIKVAKEDSYSQLHLWRGGVMSETRSRKRTK